MKRLRNHCLTWKVQIRVCGQPRAPSACNIHGHFPLQNVFYLPQIKINISSYFKHTVVAVNKSLSSGGKQRRAESLRGWLMGGVKIERTFAKENIRSGSRALETVFSKSPVASTSAEASEIHPQKWDSYPLCGQWSKLNYVRKFLHAWNGGRHAVNPWIIAQ